MEASRPYANMAALERAADDAWNRCSREDWLQAFAAHPQIGQRTESRWSQEEQSRAAEVDSETLLELEKLNPRYLEKFGYIFITNATGRTAGEILADLRSRLEHDAETEIRAAAEHKRLIAQLRLRKLLGGSG